MAGSGVLHVSRDMGAYRVALAAVLVAVLTVGAFAARTPRVRRWVFAIAVLAIGGIAVAIESTLSALTDRPLV